MVSEVGFGKPDSTAGPQGQDTQCKWTLTKPVEAAPRAWQANKCEAAIFEREATDTQVTFSRE